MQRPAKPCTPVRFRPQPPFPCSSKFIDTHRLRKTIYFIQSCVHEYPSGSIESHVLVGVVLGVRKSPPLVVTPMRLTDNAIRNAQPREKSYKLFEDSGSFSLLKPTGGKWWRFKYRLDGKERLLSLGTYPDVRLKEAREKRDGVRKQIAAGINPSHARKAAKLARGGTNSFEAVAREWLDKYKQGRAESTIVQVISRLDRDAFPWLGDRPVGEITVLELAAVLHRIEQRGTVGTAHRVRRHCGQVFRYAIATGRAQHDLSGDLRGALAQVKAKHRAAITDPKDVGPLLRAIDGYQGLFVTRCALRAWHPWCLCGQRSYARRNGPSSI